MGNDATENILIKLFLVMYTQFSQVVILLNDQLNPEI